MLAITDKALSTERGFQDHEDTGTLDLDNQGLHLCD